MAEEQGAGVPVRTGGVGRWLQRGGHERERVRDGERLHKPTRRGAVALPCCRDPELLLSRSWVVARLCGAVVGGMRGEGMNAMTLRSS